MLGRSAAVALLATSVATLGVAASGRTAPDACNAATVRYTHYPGPGFASLPWVQAAPRSQGLVGLLWYWPDAWEAQHVTPAQIYAGGRSPAGGPNMKILWVFLAPAGRRAQDAQSLILKGRRLDGDGKSWQKFTAISYSGQNGAPSFASIVDLPAAGCWRLDLSAGSLHGSVVFRALGL